MEHRWSNSLSQRSLSVLKPVTDGAQERTEEKNQKPRTTNFQVLKADLNSG